jgi:hypothetical protein
MFVQVLVVLCIFGVIGLGIGLWFLRQDYKKCLDELRDNTVNAMTEFGVWARHEVANVWASTVQPQEHFVSTESPTVLLLFNRSCTHTQGFIPIWDALVRAGGSTQITTRCNFRTLDTATRAGQEFMRTHKITAVPTMIVMSGEPDVVLLDQQQGAMDLRTALAFVNGALHRVTKPTQHTNAPNGPATVNPPSLEVATTFETTEEKGVAEQSEPTSVSILRAVAPPEVLTTNNNAVIEEASEPITMHDIEIAEHTHDGDQPTMCFFVTPSVTKVTVQAWNQVVQQEPWFNYRVTLMENAGPTTEPVFLYLRPNNTIISKLTGNISAPQLVRQLHLQD